MSLTVIELMLREISESKNGLMDALVMGKVDNHSKYMALVGHYRGLSEAEEIITKRWKLYEQDDDEPDIT